jgi:hypothetical protein
MMDDAMDLFLRLRGAPPRPPPPAPRPPPVAPTLRPSRVRPSPVVVVPLAVPPRPPPPVLGLASMRLLQRSALVRTLETTWAVFMLEREVLARDRSVATLSPPPMPAWDVDVVLDERTSVVIVPAALLSTSAGRERLLSFLLTTVAPAYTVCWLLLDAAPPAGATTDVVATDADTAAALAAAGHVAACLPALRTSPGAPLEVHTVVAWSADEHAAWIRAAAEAALVAAVARGTWTEAQWLQRDWLEPLESRVRPS